MKNGQIAGKTKVKNKMEHFSFSFQPRQASPISGSPNKFANQGLVYLSEIDSLEEVHELSVKQAKDILAMNRVNFKGVVEKDELLKHVVRLWKQEKQAQDRKLF